MRRWRVVLVVFIVSLLMFSAWPCHAGKAKKTKGAKASKARQNAAMQKEIPAFVAFREDLEKFLGVSYRMGGVSSKGMDCSGFAKRFFAEAFGIDLPHSSRAISHLDFLDDIPADQEEYRPSDLLFFGPSKGRINHVGIYLGEGKFIHASRREGVTVSSLQESYWKRRLLASKRVTVLDDAQLTTLAGGPGFGADDGTGESLSQTLAMGYYQHLIDSRIGVGVQGLYGSHEVQASTDAPRRDLRSDYYSGWQALVDIRPSDWLCITPWMGHLEVSDMTSGASGALGYYGLKTNIGSGVSPWSLSLAAQRTHAHDFFTPSAAINDWRSLDLGFDVGYRYGSGFSLSVSGWRSGLYPGAAAELPESLSDIALRLNIPF